MRKIFIVLAFIMLVCTGCGIVPGQNSAGMAVSPGASISPVTSHSNTPASQTSAVSPSVLPSPVISAISNENNGPLLNLHIDNANLNSSYFIANNESIFCLQNDRLCSVSIDGTNTKELDDGCCWCGLALDDNYLYYLKSDTFYRISINGTDKEKLFAEHEVYDFQVIGNQIVYQSGNNIYLFDITGRKTESIVTAVQYTGLICSSNKIYYMSDNYPNSPVFLFNEYDLQTKTTKVIKEDPNLRSDFTIIDNKLYYINSEKMNLNVINLADGTEKILSPERITVLGSFHQFIVYHTVSKEDPYSSEIRAYDTTSGDDFLISTTNNDILEVCSNDDNLFLLTVGIPHYKRVNGNDLYYIYRVDFSDKGIDMNKIKEIECNSNMD